MAAGRAQTGLGAASAEYGHTGTGVPLPTPKTLHSPAQHQGKMPFKVFFVLKIHLYFNLIQTGHATLFALDLRSGQSHVWRHLLGALRTFAQQRIALPSGFVAPTPTSAEEETPVSQPPAQNARSSTNPLHRQAWAGEASFTAEGPWAVKTGRDKNETCNTLNQ